MFLFGSVARPLPISPPQVSRMRQGILAHLQLIIPAAFKTGSSRFSLPLHLLISSGTELTYESLFLASYTYPNQAILLSVSCLHWPGTIQLVLTSPLPGLRLHLRPAWTSSPSWTSSSFAIK